MSASTKRRVQKRSEALGVSGLRPVQIPVPDTRAPGLEEEYRRQCELVAAADREDVELMDFLDVSLDELLKETKP